LIEGKEQCYTAGEQTIDLTGFDNLASGIYFLKLDFNGTKVVKKLVLSKKNTHGRISFLVGGLIDFF
jgi:hypothetical protein